MADFELQNVQYSASQLETRIAAAARRILNGKSQYPMAFGQNGFAMMTPTNKVLSLPLGAPQAKPTPETVGGFQIASKFSRHYEKGQSTPYGIAPSRIRMEFQEKLVFSKSGKLLDYHHIANGMETRSYFFRNPATPQSQQFEQAILEITARNLEAVAGKMNPDSRPPSQSAPPKKRNGTI